MWGKFQVVDELMSLRTWEERITKTTEILQGATPFPAQELAAAASSFYYKLNAADKYQPKVHFKGDVTLVRAIDNYVQMGDDYGLSTVCIIVLHFIKRLAKKVVKS